MFLGKTNKKTSLLLNQNGFPFNARNPGLYLSCAGNVMGKLELIYVNQNGQRVLKDINTLFLQVVILSDPLLSALHATSSVMSITI